MITPHWHKGLGPDVILNERLFLAELAQEINRRFDNPTIVNIGVNRGTSLHPLSAFGGRIVAIDIDLSHWMFDTSKLPEIEYIEADSTTYDFDGDVHLIFVDGDHEYPGVKGDILNWQDRVVPGGIMAFHDYNPPKFKWRLIGVERAVNELMTLDKWDVIDVKGSVIAFRRRGENEKRQLYYI